jgi:acetyl esterase/lipase
MRRRRRLHLFASFLVLALAARLWRASTVSGGDHPVLDRLRGDAQATPRTAATPPQQPATGPGGKDYPYKEALKSVFGENGGQFWIFEPAALDSVPASSGGGAPSPGAVAGGVAPAAVPVIVFVHGWGAMEPEGYGAWIEHLVKRGNIVIFPRYQENARTLMKDYTPNAVAAVKAALKELTAGSHTTPDLKRLAIVGHSMGGAIAPNIAALAAQDGLPHFSAVMCVEPGNHVTNMPRIGMPMADLSQISTDTLMLVLVGSDDRIVGDDAASEIFQCASKIAPGNKNFVTLLSDDHGTPPLRANHFAPAAPGGNFRSDPADGGASGKGTLRERLSERLRGENKDGAQRMVDALDFYGTWKLFDGLTDAAFFGKNREYALGDTPQQRFMGTWSDGVPVKEMKVMSPELK